MTRPVSLPEDVRGKVIELLDLAETLFEETIADAQRRLGATPKVRKPRVPRRSSIVPYAVSLGCQGSRRA